MWERNIYTKYLDNNIVVTIKPLAHTPHNDTFFVTFYPGDRYKINRAFFIDFRNSFNNENEFVKLYNKHNGKIPYMGVERW